MIFILGAFFGIYFLGVLIGAVILVHDSRYNNLTVQSIIGGSVLTLLWPVVLTGIIAIGMVERAFNVRLF